MYAPRMLAGLLIMLTAVVVSADELKTAESAPKGAAQDKDTPQPESPAKDTDGAEKADAATPEQLQQWIKELVHQKFATRQSASQKLVQAGVPGMEAAAEAAKTEDLELATRCLAVLTEGLTSKADDVRKAAKSALEALTKSENKSVAQRARQALETPRGIPGIPGGVGGAIARNVQQIRVQVVNGVREITVIENGKETVLKDNNGKDISVTVTETVNGQKQSQTFKGKDEDDLKKNHPEAHALFEKYSKGGNGGVRIQIGGNILVPMLPQQMRRRAIIPNLIKAAELFDEVDKLRQKLEDANARLAKIAESEKPDPAELKKISEEIQSTTKRLTEIKTESQLP